MIRYLYTIVLFLIFSSNRSLSQNLVPNASFESYSTCPTGQAQLDSAAPWFNPSFAGTPDYYNQCSAVFGVPAHWYNYQPAFQGVGYAGMYVWSTAPSVREYIEAPLAEPLEAGQCYHFRMYVNLSNSSTYSTRSIGAYLSDTLIDSVADYKPLPFRPQITYAASASRFDTLNWTLVAGDYVAHGGERYLLIGNFNDDTTSDTLRVRPGLGYAYCYIDSVSLLKKDCTTKVLEQKIPIVTITPNPFSEILAIKHNKPETINVTITDACGKIMDRHYFSGNLQLSTAHYLPAIYFYEIKNGSQLIDRGKILKY